jgi:cytochrome c
MAAYGCAGCHRLPGADDEGATIGPDLGGFSSRRNIAGSLPNTSENLAHWIADPKSVNPNTLMPDLGVTPQEAAQIAAYLESDPG